MKQHFGHTTVSQMWIYNTTATAVYCYMSHKVTVFWCLLFRFPMIVSTKYVPCFPNQNMYLNGRGQRERERERKGKGENTALSCSSKAAHVLWLVQHNTVLGQTIFFALRLPLHEPFIWAYVKTIFPKLDENKLAASQADGALNHFSNFIRPALNNISILVNGQQ